MQDPSDRRREWEQRYEQGRTGWDRGGVSPGLLAWLAADAVPRARVLVPGCGNGHEVAALVRHGCRVTAVDIADQPVHNLRAALAAGGLDAEVVQADLLQWQPSAPFDAIYEQTCLCALDPSSWPEYERRLHAWLAPGAPLLAMFMQTGRDGGPPFDCPPSRMRELFDGARWRWPAEQPRELPHPNGLHELAVRLQRRP